jgi:hypothetical protein
MFADVFQVTAVRDEDYENVIDAVWVEDLRTIKTCLVKDDGVYDFHGKPVATRTKWDAIVTLTPATALYRSPDRGTGRVIMVTPQETTTAPFTLPYEDYDTDNDYDDEYDDDHPNPNIFTVNGELYSCFDGYSVPVQYVYGGKLSHTVVVNNYQPIKLGSSQYIYSRYQRDSPLGFIVVDDRVVICGARQYVCDVDAMPRELLKNACFTSSYTPPWTRSYWDDSIPGYVHISDDTNTATVFRSLQLRMTWLYAVLAEP